MSTSQLNSVGTEVSTGIYLTLWIPLCFSDPSLLGFVAEIMYIKNMYVYYTTRIPKLLVYEIFKRSRRIPIINSKVLNQPSGM